MLFYKKIDFSQSAGQIEDASRITRLEQRDIERAFTRLFATEDGKKVLAWLQVMTFQRVQAIQASDEQLRYCEGQRNLVATILRMIDRGRGGQT